MTTLFTFDDNCDILKIGKKYRKKFLSPTVNLYIKPTDFIKFLENMEYYLSLEIKSCKTPLKYPVRSFRRYILIF